MKLTVIIPSAGRVDTLCQMLGHLARQTRAPDAVIVSLPEGESVPPDAGPGLELRILTGPKGLTAQRNTALADAVDRSDIITFFDDDFLPADNYLEVLARAFEAHPEFAVIHGNVVADGAHNAGFSFEEGLRRLGEAESDLAGSDLPVNVRDHPGAYGCNMSFRAGLVGDCRFDERLPLYGWQEDIDFTNQLGQYGRIVSLSNLIGVHLGIKGGRVNGTRLGYSQIVNPVYLVRKGTMPVTFALDLVTRNVTANVVKSFSPEPWIDRRGRLRGNMIALGHILTGRIEPEHVTRLE